MPGHDIIVVGTSAGGVKALSTAVRALPKDLPAAIFVVLHMPAEARGYLPHILNHSGKLYAVQAEDGMEIEHGCIYVARPDHHLLVEPGQVRVVRGPKENRHRPAVDPMFRSAARAYGPRVVGVVLTGALDDGTAGLLAVKRRGGVAIVQDPREALFPGMPGSALAHVEVDYTLPLVDIGPKLVRLANKQIKQEDTHLVPQDIELETKLVEMDTDTLYNEERPGKPSVFSCPECGGVLWELEDGDFLRFRCRVGHSFSIESMRAQQAEALEAALWSALKTLEESTNLSRRLAKQAYEREHNRMAMRFEERMREAEQQADVIRKIVMKGEVVVTTDPDNNGLSNGNPKDV